jgi:hypothetical protein
MMEGTSLLALPEGMQIDQIPPKGSRTRMGLASLFGTWLAQGLNPFHQCFSLLISQSSFGQV